MKKILQEYFPALLILMDYIAIVAAEYTAFSLRDAMDFWRHSAYMYGDAYIYGWVPLIFLLFLSHSHTYRQGQPIADTMRDIFTSVAAGWGASIILIYFLKAGEQASRLFVLLFGLSILCSIYLTRYIVLKCMKHYHLFYEPVLLVGAGKTAECLIRFWNGDLGYRYDIVGVVDDHPVSEKLPKELRMLGGFDQAVRIVRMTDIQRVIIAAPGLSKESLQELIAGVQPYVRNISFVPDLIGTPMAGVDASVLFSEKILMLNLRNNLARWYNRLFKRIFDLVCTICGGLLISPVLLFLTVWVAIDNGGRVIFAHQRVGKNGKMFFCYKFQTMLPNAQELLKDYLEKNPEARKEWEESFKLTHDPRVTRLGAFLRKTSLDELPQLWNVLRGDMSLVGPRPIVKEEIPRYHDNIREYYMVLPGITGMWQVSGRSDTTYEERVAMDTWYVRNWSVWIDLMYLFKTVKAVFAQRGAY